MSELERRIDFRARIAELEADADKVAANELRKLNLVINQREAQRIRLGELEAEVKRLEAKIAKLLVIR